MWSVVAYRALNSLSSHCGVNCKIDDTEPEELASMSRRRGSKQKEFLTAPRSPAQQFSEVVSAFRITFLGQVGHGSAAGQVARSESGGSSVAVTSNDRWGIHPSSLMTGLPVRPAFSHVRTFLSSSLFTCLISPLSNHFFWSSPTKSIQLQLHHRHIALSPHL